jgi:hypothetical protein
VTLIAHISDHFQLHDALEPLGAVALVGIGFALLRGRGRARSRS